MNTTTATTVCGVISGICGAIISTVPSLPAEAKVVIGCIGAAALAVMGYLTQGVGPKKPTGGAV